VVEGATTEKPVKGGVVPEGVVTVTVRDPGVASGAMVTNTVRLVELPEAITPVTPLPLNVTAVAPERFGPDTVVMTVAPGGPLEGETDVIDGATTVNPLLRGADVADGVDTVTDLAPGTASDATVISIEIDDVPIDVMSAVTPVPLNVTAFAPQRLAPWIVAATVVPGVELGGVSEEIDGGPTVKPLTGGVEPDGVVTLTVRTPDAAPGAMVTATPKVAAVTLVITPVTPVPPNVTAVAPDRFWPLMLADIVVPGAPEEGDTDVIEGKLTVKLLNSGVAPAGVLTVTERAPAAASAATVRRTERLVALPEVMAPVRPVPLNVIAVAPVRFWPVRVAETVVPGAPLLGLSAVIEGVDTVKLLNGAVVP